MGPSFQNGSCDPFQPASERCALGNLVDYSVKAISVGDVMAAVRFARERNIRLVIKNTGHECVLHLLFSARLVLRNLDMGSIYSRTLANVKYLHKLSREEHRQRCPRPLDAPSQFYRRLHELQ